MSRRRLPGLSMPPPRRKAAEVPTPPLSPEQALRASEMILFGKCNLQIAEALRVPKDLIRKLREKLTGDMDKAFGLQNVVWMFRRGLRYTEVVFAAGEAAAKSAEEYFYRNGPNMKNWLATGPSAEFTPDKLR